MGGGGKLKTSHLLDRQPIPGGPTWSKTQANTFGTKRGTVEMSPTPEDLSGK